MEYLFKPQNLRVLKSFSLVETIYAFDYDGTLAPIANTPDLARMTDIAANIMTKLNEIVPVAIITGRSVADIEKLLPFKPAFLIGNHGIEGIQTESELKEMKALCSSWMEILTRYLKTAENSQGIFIENKTYSLSIHYRNAVDPETSEHYLNYILTKLPNSRLVKGKSVINILPMNSLDKGQALEHIIRNNGYKYGFYIGDDVTDEDVFKYRGPRLITVKVGEDINSGARYFIRNQEEINELLLNLMLFHG